MSFKVHDGYHDLLLLNFSYNVTNKYNTFFSTTRVEIEFPIMSINTLFSAGNRQMSSIQRDLQAMEAGDDGAAIQGMHTDSKGYPIFWGKLRL